MTSLALDGWSPAMAEAGDRPKKKEEEKKGERKNVIQK